MTASLILGSWNRSDTSGGEARLDPEERIKAVESVYRWFRVV